MTRPDDLSPDEVAAIVSLEWPATMRLSRKVRMLVREALQARGCQLAPLETKTCSVCEWEFDVPASRSDRVYCSDACRSKAYRERINESATNFR